MPKDMGKTLGVLASIATIIGTCITAVALISSFGQWLNPREPVQNVNPTLNREAQNAVEAPSTVYIPNTEIPSPAAFPRIANSTEPTAIPTISQARMYNFRACKDPCGDGNSSNSFPAAITKINIEWTYENIPYGAKYIRKWTVNGREWIKYDCTWTGNENGRDSVKLTEPRGLHSGTWVLTVIVDGVVLLSEQITISGNWDYWDPAGTLNSCYGTTD